VSASARAKPKRDPKEDKVANANVALAPFIRVRLSITRFSYHPYDVRVAAADACNYVAAIDDIKSRHRRMIRAATLRKSADGP
jgi:hypothetical protein